MTKRLWTTVLFLLAACSDDEQLEDAATEDTDTAIERVALERDAPALPRKVTADERAALAIRVTDAEGTRSMPLDDRFGADVELYLAPGDELVLDAPVAFVLDESPEPRASTSPSASDEITADDDPAALCRCVYTDSCRLPTGTYTTIWQCDYPPFEPWVPFVGEPTLGQLTTSNTPTTSIPWPPPQCYQISVEIIHDIVCQNRCYQCGIEECENLNTGASTLDTRLNRPDELSCETVAWSACNAINECG